MRQSFLPGTGEPDRLFKNVTLLGGEVGISQGDKSDLFQSEGGGDTIGKFRLGGF